VHRDITPHNVLISWDGAVKLADFGIARSSIQASVTKTGLVKGKLGYLSPEQASGATVDARSDLYAIGVVLWELLTGRRLFVGVTEAEILARVLRGDVRAAKIEQPSVPDSLDAITTRALQWDPALRFASGLEMGRALEGALARSQTLVGSHDIAQVLASAAPNRVREHERWLREADDNTRPGHETGAASAEVSAELPTSVTAKSLRVSSNRWLPFLAALGLMLGFFVVFERMRAALSPSALPAPSVTAVTVQSSGGRPPAAVPRREPTTAASVAGQPLPVAPVQQALGAPSPGRSARLAERTVAAETFGSLNVSASPVWANVVVDGKDVGATPTVVQHLSVGSHLVEAKPQGREPGQVKRVEVAADKSTRVDFTFQ
jgi:hypothetical protein